MCSTLKEKLHFGHDERFYKLFVIRCRKHEDRKFSISFANGLEERHSGCPVPTDFRLFSIIRTLHNDIEDYKISTDDLVNRLDCCVVGLRFAPRGISVVSEIFDNNFGRIVIVDKNDFRAQSPILRLDGTQIIERL